MGKVSVQIIVKDRKNNFLHVRDNETITKEIISLIFDHLGKKKTYKYLSELSENLKPEKPLDEWIEHKLGVILNG